MHLDNLIFDCESVDLIESRKLKLVRIFMEINFESNHSRYAGDHI